MNNDEVYMTRDLALATFLRINNVRFSGKYEKETKSWYFHDPEKCEELSIVLRNGESQVEVLEYESIRRNLLGMVHDSKSY